MNRIKEQPLGIVTLFIFVIEAAIAMLIGFGYLNWTVEQVGLVMTFIVGLGALANYFLLRTFVTPKANPVDIDGTALVRSEED